MAPPLPRALLWVSGVVVGAGIAMALLGALQTGISWDEPYHVMRLQNFLDRGSFALDWAFEGDGPTSRATNTAVYGPVTMLLLHGLTALLGVEAWGSVATSPAAYDVRHLGVVLIGLVGTASAAGITRVLLGSWQWALFTAASLLALPMWTGHLMFNIKDVPVATGYTLVTLASVCMASPARRHRAFRVGCLTAGIVLMVGTRPAMAAAAVVSLVLLAVGLGATRRDGQAGTALGEALVGVLLASTVLLLVYPSVFAHPETLMQSAEQSARFRGGRTAAYGYVPFHVLAQVPLLLQGFFAVGLLTGARFILVRWRADTPQAMRLALVGAQLAALPLFAIAMHSDLYNGLRQLLFASPAWAVLATVGAVRALVWARARGRSRVVGGVALAALLAPTLDQALLFPYQYTYFNVALDATGVHVASDYWRTSVPELLPRLPTNGQIVCGPTRSGDEENPETMLAGRYSSDSSVDCRVDPLGPLSSAWAAEGLRSDDELRHDEFYALIDRDHPVPANCARLAGVTRNRHGGEIQMTYVARCALEPSLLGATPVTFERPATEPSMAPELWAFAPEGWVMRASSTGIDAEGGSASLTFEVPESCAGHTCVLLVDADAPADLTATVNDAPTTLFPASDSVGVRLPPGISGAWVTFARESGEPLGLRVRSIRLTPVPDHQ